ncbi:MAG TPA: helix-turn-helix domain-containing protein [Caulobacteraceae bacterium]|nr:helix-turn-helix domain-containing protein [Caulobacteraceae bacterium]
MDILSPEDRVILWRETVDAAGPKRQALLHAIAREVVDSLCSLNLYAGEYTDLVVSSLAILDDAQVFASDEMRLSLETLHEPAGGADHLAATIAGLLRDASGVGHLGADRRVQAIDLASAWREHVLERPRTEPEYISVGDVAARYGVTTQAVYKWLKDGRIEATRGPGGSWRIPRAQFDSDTRPAASRADLDALRQHLIRVHADQTLPGEDELSANMRGSERA